MRHLKIVKWVFVPVFFAGIIAAAIVNFYNADYAKNALDFFRARFLGGQSVEEAVAKYEPVLLSNTKKSDFIARRGFPKEVLFFADKSKRILSVYGRAGDKEKFEHLKDYPFTGFSGKLGPKLKRGDRQIPEGIYGIEYLNPNSTFHLSLKVSYPGDFDVKKALADGRKPEELGGDIMIHGRSGTVGCIPIGDDAVEEVFIIAAKAGIHNIKVIISPCNLLSGEKNFAKDVGVPWYGELIENIRTEMLKYKALGVVF